MPTVANYLVITDSTFVLTRPGGPLGEGFTFELPANFDPAFPGVLTGMIYTLPGATNLLFEVHINSVLVKTLPPITDANYEYIGLQEVVEAGILQTGENRLEISLTGGNGSLRFSDFVLLHGVIL